MKQIKKEMERECLKEVKSLRFFANYRLIYSFFLLILQN